MLIDAHIHYDISGDAKKIARAMEITNTDACCLQSQIYRSKINQNFDLFYAKLKLGKKVYLNLALDSSLYFNQEQMSDMPKYIQRMMECGMDGIKMIEGKPTERKLFPIPNFDDPIFDETFAYIEKAGIHITWHVNDPEEFWDSKLVPDWARRSGWFYGDSSYVNNIDQYHQIENLLSKHPNLKITFAHFFFKSSDLAYLAKLFDNYPNVGVDITPGIELFTNLSSNIAEARIFFHKYSDRILYGTDISIDGSEPDSLNEADAITRNKLCHEFLSQEKTILKGDENGLLGRDDLELNCLNLSSGDIEKIESLNFLKRYTWHTLNEELILQEIAIHRQKLKAQNLSDVYLDDIEKAFKNHLIAYCGLDCSKCEARIATLTNDDVLRAKVAHEWSILNKVEITKEMINCEGCRLDGVKTPFCEALCPIRLCVTTNHYSSCGSCMLLDSCDKIKMIISNNQEALNNLKQLTEEK